MSEKFLTQLKEQKNVDFTLSGVGFLKSLADLEYGCEGENTNKDWEVSQNR